MKLKKEPAAIQEEAAQETVVDSAEVRDQGSCTEERVRVFCHDTQTKFDEDSRDSERNVAKQEVQVIGYPAPQEIYRASFYGADSKGWPHERQAAQTDVARRRRQEVVTLAMRKTAPGRVGAYELADDDSTLKVDMQQIEGDGVGDSPMLPARAAVAPATL